ncbi:glycosyltransferase family 2 protein [Candidatus Lokiarchaeum ossiferum]|uniref:glycosyltransferase family 2 protein n=1 Tax=Candidatus Lokiarchaeum ossiferum TaxID=2951803 RepID=UPI00352EB0EE
MEKSRTYPLTSVIIPTHNRPYTLKRAIKSVLSQTYPNIEVIVINDHSSSDLSEISRSMNDERVNFYDLEGKKGAQAARNLGISIAKGEFIAFLDDDDEFYPTKLMKQFQIFSNGAPELGLVYCGYIKKMESNQKLYEAKLPTVIENPRRAILKSNFIGSCSYPMIRSKYLNKLNGFDETLESAQDWDLWIRITQKYEIGYVCEYLVTYYIQRQSISSSYLKKVMGILKILIKNYSNYIKYPAILSNQLNNLGFRLLLNNNYELANKFYLISRKIQPNKFNSYFFMYLNTFILNPFYCLFRKNLINVIFHFLKQKNFQARWLLKNKNYLNSINITT